MNVLELMLDESMSGWRPKTSKTGGLPHISYEARKPVPLGTMLRNSVECTTGIFVHHDIVESSTDQWKKKYSDPPTKSSLPRGEMVSYHTAEVLRQAEGANVLRGGWVGGDAWFGSIESCIELKKRLGLYSTFIIKQNVQYFPMKILHAVLVARHGSRPAGHWVVMQANIGGVELYVMAYAWSSKGVAYMVSSCGKTVRHEQSYISRFEDEYGNVQEKELPRPAQAHMLYEFLPLIDEHNKARQNSLALEKCWMTKSCWNRIITTLLGMAVVDVQRWDRNKRHGYMMRPPSGFGDDDDDGVMDDFDIKTMANLIGRPLTDGRFKYYRKSNRPSQRVTASTNMDGRALTRIIGEDGSWNYAKNNPDEKTRCRQKSCFICQRYTPRTINTQWMCVRCNMPLCQIDRSDRKTRMYSCVVEHSMTHNQILGCGFVARMAFTMPDQLKAYKLTRSEKKKREERNDKRKRLREEAKAQDQLEEDSEDDESSVVSPPPLRRSSRFNK